MTAYTAIHEDSQTLDSNRDRRNRTLFLPAVPIPSLPSLF